MQMQDEDVLHRLEPGQLWKLEQGYVYIVETGRRLIHYRMLRQPSQNVGVTRLIGIEALLNYLRTSDAQLIGK